MLHLLAIKQVPESVVVYTPGAGELSEAEFSVSAIKRRRAAANDAWRRSGSHDAVRFCSGSPCFPHGDI